MSENTTRGAAEENAGVPVTPQDEHEPASPSSTPGGDSFARGAAEDAAEVPQTE